MSEYRDELAAAHARIAELEDKVRALEAEARGPAAGPSDGRFPALEAEVALYRHLADPQRNAKRRSIVTWIAAVFPFLGIVFTSMHQPLYATMTSVCFIALIAYSQLLPRQMKANAKRLEEAEKKLADARRIADLEARLAATKVRVAETDDGEELLVDELEGAGHAAVRRGA